VNVTDPSSLGVRDAVRRVADGVLSPVEVTEATLLRIAALEPRVNAFITVFEHAAAEARRVEARLGVRRDRRGALPLAGAVLSIKDLIVTTDAPTTAGSRAFGAGITTTRDAPVVARLRRAGAVIVGKTNLHEIAMGVTTVNEHFGPSRNPWDTNRIAGGSSGGSAAAVAAGMGCGSVGTDTRGSIRIPAACCGVTGFKPTRGLLPTGGVVPLSWTLDHVGPIARSVEDAAALLAAMAVPPRRGARYLRAVDAPPPPLRLGVCDYYFDDVDPEIDEAVRAALALLARVAGGADGVRAVRIPSIADSQPASAVITGAEALAYHESRLRETPDGFGPLVQARLRSGMRLTALDLVQAERVRAAVAHDFARAFRDVDVIVAPAVAALPHRVDEGVVRIAGREAPTLDAFTRLNSPQNMAGVPALALPCGMSRNGLPIGLQLIAARGRDDVVLALGAAFQRETDWHRRWPPLA